jgi:L-ascorbate 6-phosphate lactonase
MATPQSRLELIEEINATETPFRSCAFWWLGQHGFAIKLGSTVLYIDPYLTPSDSRNIPPLLDPADVTNADAVIGTHDHSDHIDRPSWPTLAKASPGAIFVVPKFGMSALMADLGLPEGRVAGLDDGLSVSVAGVKITAIPAAHEFLSTHPETGHHEFLGMIIEGNGFCLYHAGDTCIYEGIQARLRNWKIDLAFLPINGRDATRLRSGCIGNMTFQEAVDLAGSIQPGLVVPTHFEMFDGNTENPELFADYLSVKYPHVRGQVPLHGARVLVQASRA